MNGEHDQPEQQMQQRLAAIARHDFRIVRDGAAVTPELAQEVLAGFDQWRMSQSAGGRPLSVKAAAERAGVRPGDLSDAARVDPSERVIRALDVFLAEEEARRNRYDFGGFARVGLTDLLFGFFNLQIRLGGWGVIIAPPGSCKTTHGEAFARMRHGTQFVRVTCEPADGPAVSEMLCGELSNHQGARPLAAYQDRTHRRRAREIIHWLAAHKNAVLVLDEAQKLSTSGLEFLRDLYDTSDAGDGRKMPILMLADKTFRGLLDGSRVGKRAGLTSQLRSRISVLDVAEYSVGDGDGGGLYTTDDIVALVRNKRLRLVTPEGVRWLRDLANVRGTEDGDGHLRLVVGVLRTCVELYRAELDAGEQLTPVHMRAALMQAFASRASQINASAGGALLAATA